MVRDAYSAGGQQADGSTTAQSLDVRGNTANLTQELAQLLAQSIAQGQSGKRPSGAAATGSELASLAALVSASQNQRGQPYKDGLSSLSYARPAPSPVAPPPPVAPAGGMLVSEPHDEEPMPIPSTWRQPMLSDDDRWYRQQLGAAGLGLVAGLIVVVPAVLWLSGYLGGPQTKAPRPQVAEQPAVKMAEVKPVPVKVQVASADVRPKADAPPAAEAPPALPPRVEPARSRADDLMAQARRRLDNGDILGAREILQAPESATSGPMTFMLAETYDPSVLAGWGVRQPISDVIKARSLYTKALRLGYARAQERLDIDWIPPTD
jgi:hypothetical protein